MRIFRQHSPLQYASYLMFALSALILGSTLYFIFSIKVLAAWRIILPTGDIHVGDTIVLKSEYTKLRDVQGRATRYIDCQNRAGVMISYSINEAPADHAVGNGGTGVVLYVPSSIPDLPTYCQFRILLDYPVLPFRHVYQSNHTASFRLLPKVSAAVAAPVAGQKSAIQTSPAQVRVSAPTSLSSPNSTTSVVSPQSNFAQQPASQSLLQRVEFSITSLF